MNKKEDSHRDNLINKSYLFTSESVTEGHPDKLADQISDAVLDEALAQDPYSRVACEALVSRDLVVVAGEITTRARLDMAQIARRVITEVGYGDETSGFDLSRCHILLSIKKQSEEIARAINNKSRSRSSLEPQQIKGTEVPEHVVCAEDELGAGDQGMMFGYATDETPELMPLPIMLAHRLVMKAAELRKSGEIPWLLPDGKSQVTVRYENDRPVAVERVVLSFQHKKGVGREELCQTLKTEIIEQVIPSSFLSDRTQYLINPSAQFTTGGPAADTGLTGRKIIVDTYGGSCPHGGGSFSGKDPTKVDRSGAYAARYIAKNIVAAGLARRCTVQLSYAIGLAEPTSVLVNTHGTAKVEDKLLKRAVQRIFPLQPGRIIAELNLRRPIYQKTAAYGHFGRELPDFTWEHANQVQVLRSYFEDLKSHSF